MPHTVPSSPTNGAVEPVVRQPAQTAFEATALAGDTLTQCAVDELGTIESFDQAAAFMTLVVGRCRSAVECDLREWLPLGLVFHEAHGFLGRCRFPERVADLFGPRADRHDAPHVDDDVIPRHHRHQNQDHEHHKSEWIEIVEQVVEAHLLQGRGIAVAAYRSGRTYIWNAARCSWLCGSWILLHNPTLCLRPYSVTGRGKPLPLPLRESKDRSS
jgi:hypothetical protein